MNKIKNEAKNHDDEISVNSQSTLSPSSSYPSSSSSTTSSSSSDSSSSSSSSDSSDSLAVTTNKKKKKRGKLSKKKKQFGSSRHTSYSSDSSYSMKKKSQKRKSKHLRHKYNTYAKRNPSLFDELNFPKAPVSTAKLETFIQLFTMKIQHTGCAKYIKDNKKKRPIKPEKSNHKAYKQWKKDIHWIAIALQTTLMGNEALIWIQDYTDGVKAWDTLMEKYHIIIFNKGAARSADMQALQSIRLSSISKGSYSHFISKFEKVAATVRIDNKRLSDDTKYNFLIGQIEHEAYDGIMTIITTQTPPFTYQETLHKLLIHSKKLEVKTSRNSNTKTTTSNVHNIRINGYEVDKDLNMSQDKWSSITEAQKKEFVEKRKQYRKEHALPYVRPQKSNNSTQSPSNTPSKSKIRRTKRKEKQRKRIDDLVQALVTVSAASTDTTTSNETPVTSNTSNDQTADLSKLPSHVKQMVRTLISNNSNLWKINFSKKRYFRNASTQDTFKVTVDGGANTCLYGQGHLFLEYTERKANVIGFDEELERKDLRIGTSITKLTLPDGFKILLMKNESIDHTSQPNSMLSVNQVQANGLDVDDCPTCYKRLTRDRGANA